MQKRGFKGGARCLVVSNPAVEAVRGPLLGAEWRGFETSLLQCGRGRHNALTTVA